MSESKSILPNKEVLKEGDPCPNCEEGRLERWIRWGKDTGNLVCPTCWYKCTPEGEYIKSKKVQKFSKKFKAPYYDGPKNRVKTEDLPSSCPKCGGFVQYFKRSYVCRDCGLVIADYKGQGFGGFWEISKEVKNLLPNKPTEIIGDDRGFPIE